MRRFAKDFFARVTAARWTRYVFSYGVAAVLVALAAHVVWRHGELFLSLVSTGFWWLPVVGLMVAISLVTRAYFLHQLVCEVGQRRPAGECLCLVAATHMLSMLAPPPTGGAYRALYLYRHYGIEVLPLASGTALFVVMGVLVWCVLGMVALLASGLTTENVYRPLLLVTLVSGTALVAAWQAKGVLRMLQRGGLTQLAHVAGGSSLRVASSRRVGMAAFLAELVSAPVQVVGYYLILHSFGLTIGLSDSTSILAFHQLSGVIGLTPGGVGVQEGAGVIVAGGLGLPLAELVVVFALIRAARIGVSILIGVPCWWLLPGHKATHAIYGHKSRISPWARGGRENHPTAQRAECDVGRSRKALSCGGNNWWF